MKRFPFQWVASGKRGVPRWEWVGPCCLNREGGYGTTLPATRSVDAPLPRTGKCRAARSGRYHAARNGTPVGHIPESSSATLSTGCCIAKPAFCQVCRIAKSTCRIARSDGLLSLLYCQVCRKHGVPGFG